MNNYLGCLAVVETSVPGFFGELKISLSTLRLANDKYLIKYRNAGEAPAQLDISVLIQCIKKRASTFHRAAAARLLDFQAETAQQIGKMRRRKRDKRHKTMMFSALSRLSFPLLVPHENTTTQPSPQRQLLTLDYPKYLQRSTKRFAKHSQEGPRQGQAEQLRNSRNKLHATWSAPFSLSLYIGQVSYQIQFYYFKESTLHPFSP